MRVYIEPTVVLVSNRINEAVINRFDPEAGDEDSESGHSESVLCHLSPGLINKKDSLPFLLEVRPSSEFYYEEAKSKMLNLRLGENNGPRVTFIVPGDVIEHYNNGENKTSRQGQLLRLAGWIDMDSRLTVSLYQNWSQPY